MARELDKYSFEKYCYSERWNSYYHQIKEIAELNPSSVLDVGAGDGFLGEYLRKRAKIIYKSVDNDESLKPDILASIEKIPVNGGSFDLVCAFEVLEHLPFERFEQSLLELKKASEKWIIISLPHFGPPIKFLFKAPFLKELKFSFKIPFWIKHKTGGEHFWEIGKRGYSSRKIRKIIKKHFVILKEFIPFENQYHHFYVLKKK